MCVRVSGEDEVVLLSQHQRYSPVLFVKTFEDTCRVIELYKSPGVKYDDKIVESKRLIGTTDFSVLYKGEQLSKEVSV